MKSEAVADPERGPEEPCPHPIAGALANDIANFVIDALNLYSPLYGNR